MQQSILKEKSEDFALRIVNLYKYLRDEHREFVLSKQVLRSGTSIGANIAEAFYGQSDADFISKLSVAQKETSETTYWIDLLHRSEFITQKQYESIMTDVVELQKLLTASIKTMKQKLKTKKK